MIRKLFFVLVVSLLFCVQNAVAQSIMVCNRGLPTINLNNISGANRSNVAWSFGNDWITGDDCTFGSSGEVWVVTKVVGWNTQGIPNVTEMGDRFKSIGLFLGQPGETLTQVSNGTLALGSSTNSNPNITHTRVQYANGADYQGSSTAFIQIWENAFNNLVFVANGGSKLYFSGDGILQDGLPYNWFNHASNAALSGSVQEDADNFFLGWDRNDLTSPFECDTANKVDCGGWDKSSDINVQVWAELLGEGSATGGGWFVPEPTNSSGLLVDGSKATFGFIARNKKAVASGNLEFQYQASGINLKSSAYDFAHIVTTQAIFEGQGSINNVEGYKFRVRAVDGDKLGNVADRFEIRIWTGGNSFDSPLYKAEGDLSGGQIVVHKK